MVGMRMSPAVRDVERLNARLDVVQGLHEDALMRTELIATLKSISDLERLTNRVVSGIAGPRDLLALRQSLTGVPALQQTIRPATALHSLIARLDPCQEDASQIETAIAQHPPAQ